MATHQDYAFFYEIETQILSYRFGNANIMPSVAAVGFYKCDCFHYLRL